MSFFLRELAEPAVDAAGPAIEWEEANCPLCGCRTWSQLLEAPDNMAQGGGLWFAVVQCQECGLCFTNPRPGPDSILRFYPKVYWPERAPNFPKRRRQERRRRWLRDRSARKFLPLHGQGRLLDFGCGGGSFLERTAAQGWQVTGVDISRPSIQRIRSELGLRALVGTLPHRELQPGSFDVITMWHSLEHVHEPRAVLREAYFLLAPGGKILIAVPNIESLPFRWFRGAWYGLDLPRHLTHFSPRTLTMMLERAGFHVGPVRMVRQTSWMRSSASIACNQPDAPSRFSWLRTKAGSRLASWYTCLTRQADCILVTASRGD